MGIKVWISSTGVRAAGTGLAVLAVLTGTVHAGQRPLDATPPIRSQTIVVLRFANISGAEADQWIGGGIADTLVTDLQMAPGTTVISVEMLSRAVRDGAPVDLDGLDEPATLEMSRALGVRWLIAGEYQRLANRLRITARLRSVETGAVVHSVKVDGAIGELFVMQDRVVDAMGTQLGMANDLSGRATRADAARVDPLDSQPLLPDPLPASPPAVPDAGPRPADSAPAGATAGGGFAVPTLTRAIDGPPPPRPPETVARDAAGRVTLRAVRVTEPLSIDGVLDEQAYRDTPPASDFIQSVPDEGRPATERTELWVMFDGDNLYVSGRCWDSAPESQWVANEMRRDSPRIIQNEGITILLDTFYDRRNGILLSVNPIGGRMDGQVTDERMQSYNADWNPIWQVEPGRFENGWTFEAAIPFKSLRYAPGLTQVWGMNLSRRVRWKNETSYLVPMPAAREPGSIFLVSLAATLVGVEVPDSDRTLELKPYGITDLTSDLTEAPPVSNALGGEVGLDVKYTVTQNVVADLTVNTDFAQVEADQQQVNLTRFSLFFPEKREFFLENQGVFAFGGAGANPFGGGGETPVLFYSRRIGLQGGRAVPIDVGGRLTGRVGKFTVGVLTVQTDDAPAAGASATNFSVVRLKRNLLRRSSIGAIFTGRSVSLEGAGSSRTYGVDGTFSFFDNLNLNTYWATTETPGLRDDDVSYRAQLDYQGDRYGLVLEHLVVGDEFNPEMGFLRRRDFERSFGSARFSPRPRSIAAIRRLTWQGRFDYFANRAGVVETRLAQGQFGIEFENSDTFNIAYTNSYEFLEVPFQIAPDVTIPVGGYPFQDVRTSYQFGQQRWISGAVSVQHGSFFSGEKTSVNLGLGGGFGGGRLELTPQVSVEPGLSLNRIDLPEGRFTTKLFTARTTYTVTPSMFVSALVQYNSSNDSLGANIRFRWEYQPGSELFVVYNEQRDTLTPRFPELENRAFIIKINRWFRF